MFTQRTALRYVATIALGLFSVLGGDAVSSQDRPRDGGRVRSAWFDGRRVVDGEVLVRFRATSGAIERQRAEFQTDVDEVEAVGRRGTRRMRSRRLTTSDMLETLRANPDVEFAEPNYLLNIASVPNEAWFPSLWGLFNNGQPINGVSGVAGADIDVVEAWNVTTGSRAIVVGVVDTGIDYNHPDLAANIWSAPREFQVTIGGVVITCGAGTHGFNAITNTCNPFDDQSHGTHVAGTIGANGNNGVGIAGVNWTASMMGLKFLGASGSGSTANAIKAIEFAIQAKAVLGADADVRILSNSWGGGGYSQSLRNEIDAAHASDILFVAAAGNNAGNNDAVPHYPSSYPTANMISVAATTNRDQRATFSNWGAASVHIGAPGQAILSTVPNNGYAYFNGTSMATPHVAGAAALVLAACPPMPTATLKAAILDSADPVAAMAGLTTTGGRLNVNSAVRSCTFAPSTLTVTNPTVVPGGTIQVVVDNGVVRARDWVGLYPVNGPDFGFLDWKYLNGAQSLPAAGVANATLQFAAPATPGAYNLRLFTVGYTKLATSVPITVAPQPVLTINDVAVVEGHSGTKTASFTVTLNPANATQTVAVSYATTDVTATSGSDYVAANGTLHFPPDTATQVVSVLINGDTVTEPSEAFAVNLSHAINAVIGDAQGIGTITSDDLPPPPSVSLGMSTITTNQILPIAITISNGPGLAGDWIGVYPAAAVDHAFVDWSYLNGSKTAPVSGVSNTTIYIPAPQAAGSYNVRLFTNGYTRLATTPLTVVPSPTLSISDAIVTEGHSGTVNATFTVTLTSQLSNVVTATWSTGDGTATGGSDYAAGSGVLTFSPPSKTQTITIAVNGDTAIEPSETFVVNLAGSAGAIVLDHTGVGTIVTDDLPPAPSLTLAAPTVNPGGTIEVTLSNGPGGPTDWIGLYPVSSSDGAFVDWLYLNGLKTPPATGVASITLRLPAPATSGAYQVRLFTNGYTRLATSASFTIAPTPVLTIDDVAIVEGHSGTTIATLRVSLSMAQSQPVTVRYETADGTASSGNDYTATSGTLTFAPSVTSQTITVPIVGDTSIEPSEVFFVNLSNATYAAIADGQGLATIVTDETGAPPSLLIVTPVVSRGGLIDVMVTNAPGLARDWIGLYEPASPDYVFADWVFLNGLKTPPASGQSFISVRVPAPTVAGTYHLRLFTNGYTRLATSATLTVSP
jgi:subtilisin family serine protease